MRKRAFSLRKAFALVLLVVLSTGAILIAKYRVPDPKYEGRFLSSILISVRPSGFSWSFGNRVQVGGFNGADSETLVAKSALERLGPKAIPLVKKWFESERPGWMVQLVRKFPKSRWIPPTWRVDLKEKAILAAFFSPAVGRGTLNQLLASLTNTPHALLAAGAIVETVAASREIDREKIVRELLIVQSNELRSQGYKGGGSHYSWPNTLGAANFALEGIDPQHWFRSVVILERGEEPARVGAAKKVIEDRVIAKRALPLLITNLQSPNRAVIEACADSLGSYGGEAIAALPFLSNHLSHPKLYVRQAASNAITRINADIKAGGRE